MNKPNRENKGVPLETQVAGGDRAESASRAVDERIGKEVAGDYSGFSAEQLFDMLQADLKVRKSEYKKAIDEGATPEVDENGKPKEIKGFNKESDLYKAWLKAVSYNRIKALENEETKLRTQIEEGIDAGKALEVTDKLNQWRGVVAKTEEAREAMKLGRKLEEHRRAIAEEKRALEAKGHELSTGDFPLPIQAELAVLEGKENLTNAQSALADAVSSGGLSSEAAEDVVTNAVQEAITNVDIPPAPESPAVSITDLNKFLGDSSKGVEVGADSKAYDIIKLYFADQLARDAKKNIKTREPFLANEINKFVGNDVFFANLLINNTEFLTVAQQFFDTRIGIFSNKALAKVALNLHNWLELARHNYDQEKKNQTPEAREARAQTLLDNKIKKEISWQESQAERARNSAAEIASRPALPTEEELNFGAEIPESDLTEIIEEDQTKPVEILTEPLIVSEVESKLREKIKILEEKKAVLESLTWLKRGAKLKTKKEIGKISDDINSLTGELIRISDKVIVENPTITETKPELVAKVRELKADMKSGMVARDPGKYNKLIMGVMALLTTFVATQEGSKTRRVNAKQPERAAAVKIVETPASRLAKKVDTSNIMSVNRTPTPSRNSGPNFTAAPRGVTGEFEAEVASPGGEVAKRPMSRVDQTPSEVAKNGKKARNGSRVESIPSGIVETKGYEQRLNKLNVEREGYEKERDGLLNKTPGAPILDILKVSDKTKGSKEARISRLGDLIQAVDAEILALQVAEKQKQVDKENEQYQVPTSAPLDFSGITRTGPAEPGSDTWANRNALNADLEARKAVTALKVAGIPSAEDATAAARARQEEARNLASRPNPIGDVKIQTGNNNDLSSK
ncbi:MAG: hypothetical protein WCV83_00370 [Candidatus Magasanikbacteria bacterium]